MDTSARAIAAYGQAQKGAATERGIEYQVFARINAALGAAERKGKSGFVHRAHALYDNRRLWDAIIVDLIDDANVLPPELRARLLSLGMFVRHHGEQVLRDGAKVKAITDVNQAVMDGLRGIVPQPVEVPLGRDGQ